MTPPVVAPVDPAARAGPGTAPGPAAAEARATEVDPQAWLQACLTEPGPAVVRHRLPDGRWAWVKRAGARHGPWGYRVLALLTRVFRLDVLSPVPNPGGTAAVRNESQRLRALADRGLCVPRVLAECERGLLIEDIGNPERPGRSLGDELGDAWPQGSDRLLPPWADGLRAIAAVHAADACLSKAFARNLVRTPDGRIGFIDFEDDPLAVLPLAQAQARDWLSYLHSTALAVHESGSTEAAVDVLRKILDEEPAGVRAALDASARRMRWLGRLPADRRWGRDLQRTGAAARLLHRARPPV